MTFRTSYFYILTLALAACGDSDSGSSDDPSAGVSGPVTAADSLGATTGATTSAPNAATGSDGDTIAIDPERRARLVAFVEGNNRMPEAAKDRILSQLRQADVPAALL